jgi:hypothetical protein
MEWWELMGIWEALTKQLEKRNKDIPKQSQSINRNIRKNSNTEIKPIMTWKSKNNVSDIVKKKREAILNGALPELNGKIEIFTNRGM